MRQVNACLGGRAPVFPDRDVTHRLERFVGQRVLLARDRIVMRVTAETSLERALEIRAPDTLEFVVEFDRKATGLRYGAELTADKNKIRVDGMSRLPSPGPGMGLTRRTFAA